MYTDTVSNYYVIQPERNMPFFVYKCINILKDKPYGYHRVKGLRPYGTREQAEEALAQYADKNGLSKIDERG